MTNCTSGFLSKFSKVYTFAYQPRPNKILMLISFFIVQLKMFVFGLRFSKSYDLFYINTLLPFGLAIAGTLKGVPTIYHVHEVSIRPTILLNLLKFICRFTSSKVIFVSHCVEDSFKPRLSNGEVIYNSLSAEFLKSAERHTYQARFDEKFTVTLICSLKKYKGVHNFTSLAKQLAQFDDIHFQLILNASSAELDDFFNYDLPKNLSIRTNVEDMDEVYSKTNLVLNLSHKDRWIETFGMTILEAMAYGVPVIAPDVGGPSEIIEHGVNGYLIDPVDSEDLRSTVLRIYNDRSLAKNISANNIKKAQNFSPNKFKKNLFDAILK